MNASTFQLKFQIHAQPTDTSCGPTCLQAVYRFYHDDVPVESLIEEIPELEAGGTLAVHLGIHALKRGYKAILYTYNLHVFDPSWFRPEVKDFRPRLETLIEVCADERLRHTAKAYLEFHTRGGMIRFQDLNGKLIRGALKSGRPILTGLSSTFLYRSMREIPETDQDDDILGAPCGHFVVLCGYDKKAKKVMVADPYEKNPLSDVPLYPVPMDRLLNSILLGVLTYDANLLIISPH